MNIEKNNEIEQLLFNIYDEQTLELDNYIEDIRESLLDYNLTNEQLEQYVITLPMHLYWLITETEKLGIQEDFAKLRKNEIYNQALKLATGKVDEKRAIAEEQSQAEALIHLAFSRAYKLMKGKIEMAQELLNSSKKILTIRISENELGNNRYSNKERRLDNE